MEVSNGNTRTQRGNDETKGGFSGGWTRMDTDEGPKNLRQEMGSYRGDRWVEYTAGPLTLALSPSEGERGESRKLEYWNYGTMDDLAKPGD